MQQTRHVIDQQDDAGLLAECLNGNEDAWTQLIERYSRLVYSIALKSGLAEQDAADATQNVFTIVLRRLESLQQVDRFSAWLITITRRESWRLKKSHREDSLGDDIDQIDPDPDVEAQIVDWEHALLIHRALLRLGDRCRQLLELLFLRDDQPRYESIAAELGIAVGSIGPIRARCLQRLKANLAEHGIIDSSR